MEKVKLYTIGHGRQPIEEFIAKLKANNIAVLADVRAVPRSRWPQFNQKALVVALGEAQIRYVHFPELGWKVQAPPPDFEQGLIELLKLAGSERSCMMCAESLPDKCHRTLILAPPLMEKGADILHIYPDGEVKLMKIKE